MLKKLRIDQFVIIDKLELELQSGLTILTGETGAGKSILLDAMGLILGEPAEIGAIRQGAPFSDIEAIFGPPETHPIWKILGDQNLVGQNDQTFAIRRFLRAEERPGDIQVNGRSIDLEFLKKIGTHLVEIHGQFANQSLLAPSNQLTLLDLSGGFPPEIFANVANALSDVHHYTQALEDENTFQATHKREWPRIEKLVNEFEKYGMEEGFVEHVKDEYARLLTAKETSESFQGILSQLIAANGVVMGLATANNILARNPNLDAEKMVDLTRYLAVALEHARAAVEEMRELAPEYEIDLEPLERYSEIMLAFKRIARENKITFEELEGLYMVQAGKLKRLRTGQDTIAALQDKLIEAKNNYRHHAHILHEKRVEAGKALSTAITAELAPLKLMRAEFSVLVEERANMPWTNLGLDHVTFTARMNPGMPFSPVAETASGGELARLILALKVVVQRVQTIPTLIFDEVDTGIGGAAAAAVGERLALLAENTQVLVITHSPQVASRGDQHLHVSKQSDGITTTSVLRTLNMNERVDEISRMLAGDVITEESRAAARSLIQEASTAAIKRRTAPPPPPAAVETQQEAQDPAATAAEPPGGTPPEQPALETQP